MSNMTAIADREKARQFRQAVQKGLAKLNQKPLIPTMRDAAKPAVRNAAADDPDAGGGSEARLLTVSIDGLSGSTTIYDVWGDRQVRHTLIDVRYDGPRASTPSGQDAIPSGSIKNGVVTIAIARGVGDLDDELPPDPEPETGS